MTNKLSVQEEEEDDVEKIKAYKSWKSVILLYELAQALSIFHTFMFFVFWRPALYRYYHDEKLPLTQANRIIRVILLYAINTFPPV